MTTKARKFNVFQPIKKTDRVRAAYLGLDGSCIVTFERRTPLGTQEYLKATTQVRNLHVSDYSNYSLGSDESRPKQVVHRIVLMDSALGLLTIPLATGKTVRLEVWPNNGSENTKAKGYVNQTLVVEVPGLGRFSASEIPGLIGNGFTIQGPNIDGWGTPPEPVTADTVRRIIAEGRWGLDRASVLASEDPVIVWRPRDHQEQLLFRPLTTAEVVEFQRHAALHEPDLAQWNVLHPVCREEWVRLGKVRLDAAGQPIDPDEFKNAADKASVWEAADLEAFAQHASDTMTELGASVAKVLDTEVRDVLTTDPTLRQVAHAYECSSRKGEPCDCGTVAAEGRL